MHSQYTISIDKQFISETDTFLSLSRRDLKAKNYKSNNSSTRSYLTNKISYKNIQTVTDSKCRLCQKFYETLEHFISACPKLSKEKYVKRTDRVYIQLHIQGNMGKIAK